MTHRSISWGFFWYVQPKYKTKSGYNANCYFLTDKSFQLRDVTRPNLSSLKSVWSQDIILRKSSHFSSSDPGYSSCYPDFFSPANPTSTFSLGHLIKQNSSVKKTENLQEVWISFGVRWAPGAAPRDDKSGAGSEFAEGLLITRRKDRMS